MIYNVIMEISAQIQGLYELIKTTRRELHKIPELSDKEFKTSEYIAQFLFGLGFKPKKIATGLYIDIKGTSKRKIALRCDIDALPIKENSGESFASTNGCMHACGHDGHTAILLGLASFFKLSPPKNSIRLIFQFGEEGSGGAVQMIEAGVLEGVDEIYAIHVDPESPKGELSTCYGAMFAGAIELNILVKGRSSHCAEPTKGIDALKTFNYFYSNIDSIVDDCKNNTLFHVGKVASGVARNVVADKCVAECSFRYFNPDDAEKVTMRLARLLVEADNLFKTDSSIESNVYIPLINDTEAVEFVKALEPQIKECKPRYTAEDFGAYTNVVKGCMLWLGVRDEKYTSPLHSDTFGFDEYALLYGAELFKRIAFS